MSPEVWMLLAVGAGIVVVVTLILLIQSFRKGGDPYR